MKNAVIYARYSSYNQTEMSIEGQIAECRRYAEKHDLLIIQEYIDRAQSATTDKRPNFQRMIEDSSYGTFEIILVDTPPHASEKSEVFLLYEKIITLSCIWHPCKYRFLQHSLRVPFPQEPFLLFLH